jgi:ATP-dependent Clp endopeptidase proteolytic subunit ClpP
MAKSRKKTSKNSRNDEREELQLMLQNVLLFQEHNLDINSRTIYMGSEFATPDDESGVDAKMAERCIKNIHILESLSDKDITIILNNVGGDVYHGLAIIDAIKQSKCTITIVVRGCAMSMASVILQAADRRVMGPSAVQMMHWGKWGAVDHAKTIKQSAKEWERVDKWMADFYLARIREKQPKFTMEELDKMLNFDTYLTAEQSLELGLCDEIG